MHKHKHMHISIFISLHLYIISPPPLLPRRVTSQEHEFPQIEGLLSKYAKQLLESNQKLQAVKLYRRAEAARLLNDIARDVASGAIGDGNPLLAKKLMVLSALELERFKNKMLDMTTMMMGTTTMGTLGAGGMNTMGGMGGGMMGLGGGGGATTMSQVTAATLDNLMTLDTATGLDKSQDLPWHGAEAYHFYMLSQRQLLGGDAYAAMTTALRLVEYGDVLGAAEIYSLVALTAVYCKHFAVASSALMKLEQPPQDEGGDGASAAAAAAAAEEGGGGIGASTHASASMATTAAMTADVTMNMSTMADAGGDGDDASGSGHGGVRTRGDITAAQRRRFQARLSRSHTPSSSLSLSLSFPFFSLSNTPTFTPTTIQPTFNTSIPLQDLAIEIFRSQAPEDIGSDEGTTAHERSMRAIDEEAGLTPDFDTMVGSSSDGRSSASPSLGSGNGTSNVKCPHCGGSIKRYACSCKHCEKRFAPSVVSGRPIMVAPSAAGRGKCEFERIGRRSPSLSLSLYLWTMMMDVVVVVVVVVVCCCC